MSLVLDAVSKSVATVKHLDAVSLTLKRGSLNVLLGATLAGKTSLLRVMAGLDPPSAGRVLMDGVDVTGVPVRRRNVAMVYQQFINYPTLSVFENIASPLRVQGVAGAEVEARVGTAAKLLRLEPYLKRMPLELSGGQQQRTAIARALMKGADLVLMDEPLANLDYKLREELREELPRIFEASGAIFVYATTEPAEALMLGGSTATLHQGRLTQFGPTGEVYRQPRDLTSAEVFSDPPLNVIDVAKRGPVLDFGPFGAAPAGRFAGVADGAYAMGFRAHQLSLDRLGEGALALPSTVRVSEITGSESFVHLAAGAHLLVALAQGVRNLEPGQAITTWLDPQQAFLFGQDGRLAGGPAAAAAAAAARVGEGAS
ncbi:ABC transporter ATP-binding protein [Phreatobacter stygius]|uniref:ABC transporter ATP-binding protein n=1 Tax=Phreatobacter stygius TaxID=1940610 RepID=A0A4D7B2L1_9HYPH|nr:ABC transporter ATP-binding protein [Phreatobacter stygius]QCI67794.1 ABC transporter ATP-binding protein [Phreatobacter stygius]